MAVMFLRASFAGFCDWCRAGHSACFGAMRVWPRTSVRRVVEGRSSSYWLYSQERLYTWNSRQSSCYHNIGSCLGMGQCKKSRSKDAKRQLPEDTACTPGSSHAWSQCLWILQLHEPINFPFYLRQFELGFLPITTKIPDWYVHLFFKC